MTNTNDYWIDDDGWLHDDLTKREGSVGHSIEKHKNQLTLIDDATELKKFFVNVVLDEEETQATSKEKRKLYIDKVNKIDEVEDVRDFIFGIHLRAKDYRRKLARR